MAPRTSSNDCRPSPSAASVPGAAEPARTSSMVVQGSMPADMAIEVITIGRARLWPASISAATRSMPWARISMAKSTSRIAFLVTIPISIRMPISTGIDMALPVRISAPATPPMARGSENRMVKGWITEPNSRMRTVSTSIRPRIIALPKLACSSA